MKIHELLDEAELDLLLTALRQYEKRCRGIATRPIQGYGSATESEKKRDWATKAHEISELESKIANEFM